MPGVLSTVHRVFSDHQTTISAHHLQAREVVDCVVMDIDTTLCPERAVSLC